MLFLGIQLHAQQNFASISFGGAFPLGDYAATGDLSSSGYARTGGAIKFDAGYFPVSYIGIGGSFSFNSNYALRDSMIQDLIRYVEENASSVIDIPEDAEIVYGSDFWNNISLFLGPHFSVRATQRLYFDLRALAGISVLRPPDMELSIAFDNTEIFNSVSNNMLSFGFTAGGGMRYRLQQDLALKFGVDFTQARSRFDLDFSLLQGVAEVPPVRSEFLVRNIDIMVGLAYAF